MTTQLELALSDRKASQEANLAAGKTAHRDDTDRVAAAIAGLIRIGLPFTSNDVHAEVKRDGGQPGYDRNLVSSHMGTLARQRVIVRDWDIRPTPALQRDRKGSRNPWWRATDTRSDAA